MIHKHIQYSKEQQNIKDKLLDILDLDDENSTTLYELDNNKEKINQILNLFPQIRNYFSLSNNLKPERINDKRFYLSIIKNIFKNDYYIYNATTRINKIKTVKYVFIKKSI